MLLSDIISFRKDLFFQGAVQISWFEENKPQAEKVAKHFLFHGPEYHGSLTDDYEGGAHRVVDTAYFTQDLLKRINGDIQEDPFMLAIAGYGTGKSHLGVTLATLLSNPASEVAKIIIENIKRASGVIGKLVEDYFKSNQKPYLVITLNGMRDFDLSSEITRQALSELNDKGLNTEVLEDMRPRYKNAIKFTESFYDSLENDFQASFGHSLSYEDIIHQLKIQDEEAFQKVSEIYEQKMGSPIHAVGQETLNDFIRIIKENYCGIDKPYAGMLIIFDEFGRYLEFSVHKPHIAGAGALQQLFESVQANSDHVFMLGFIQSDLNAYISRVAPELRDELKRYVTRYDAVRKVRLSTNLETIIANLLEKRDLNKLEEQLKAMEPFIDMTHENMKHWFPELKNHKLWMDNKHFRQVIWKGCWPLHPGATWMLYKLSSIGKSLQNRSAISFLETVFDNYKDKEIEPGITITPIDICSDKMIQNFLESEQYGQQAAVAHTFVSAMQKYQYEFTTDEANTLKAILLSHKVGVKVFSRDDYTGLLRIFAGLPPNKISKAIEALEKKYAVIAWNEVLQQFEIVKDAVSRVEFEKHLEQEIAAIGFEERGEKFSFNFKSWSEKETHNTDFGFKNHISTREWNYNVYYSNVANLEKQISNAFGNWRNALNVDKAKGQLIYCYLGPESDYELVRKQAGKYLKNKMDEYVLDKFLGVPIAILFLNDSDGSFGYNIAKYWVLTNTFKDEEYQKPYKIFIEEEEEKVRQTLSNQFSMLEKNRDITMATQQNIKSARVSLMLENLFSVVYPRRIPFPFDGFSTARGNAATDCQLFTKELLLGNLDRDWLATRNERQRNRAYAVLDKAWGMISKDGSIKVKPNNNGVREIIEFMEKIYDESGKDNNSKPMNFGKIIRRLCNPPYGCNIASAGLLLALFVAPRRDDGLNLIYEGQAISIENWLQYAIPKNFFDLTVLDKTEAIKVSKKSISEWEKLLDDWEEELLLEQIVTYKGQAEELHKGVQLPQQLYHKYMRLREKAEAAEKKLNQFNSIIDSESKIIQASIEKKHLPSIVKSCSKLKDLYYEVLREQDLWSKDQLELVKNQYEHARKQAQELFPQWLRQERIEQVEKLDRFKTMMKVTSDHLNKNDLAKESQRLKEHTKDIEEDVKTIASIKETIKEIKYLADNHKITQSTPLSLLRSWQEKGKECQIKVKSEFNKLRNKSGNLENEMSNALKSLDVFLDSCNKQMEIYSKRIDDVYNIKQIESVTDITYWRNETSTLLAINEGTGRHAEKLRLIQEQLELVEKHFRQMDNHNLSEKQLEQVYNNSIEETKQHFHNEPPLECEDIYRTFFAKIKEKREKAAIEWMNKVASDVKYIHQHEAQKVMEKKNALYNYPPYLSGKQQKMVEEAISKCDNRLEELELEGLLAKFNTLSEEKKKKFINLAMDEMYKSSHVNNYSIKLYY